jgi:hypothetical protein
MPISGALNVDGDITSDTTWTLANSPYSLNQNIIINDGVTLTIEPGVIVILPNDCLLQVNGRLVAEGTSSQKITMQGGGIHFGENSSDSTLTNALLDSCNLVIASSVQISGNTIIGRASVTSFEAILITAGTPTISDSSIFGADNQAGIIIRGGSPIITGNGIMGGILSEGSNVGTPVISNNTIEGGIICLQSGTIITNNLITGFKYVNFNGNVESLYNLTYNGWLGSGVSIVADYENMQHGAGAVITDNVITGCLDGLSVLQGGTTTIQRNIIVNTTRDALRISSDAIITDNTIRTNQKGIVVNNAPTLTVENNNLENNTYNFYLYTGINITATNNWWGTTDIQAIENSIWDSTFESGCGTVSINPILTAPNEAAQPNSMLFPHINMPSGSGDDNPFHIGTNSTVTDVVFDPEKQTLSFTVTGPTGTAGSTNVTIAKTVMPNGGALKVYMDGNQINYQLSDAGSSWNLGFTYIHSTHIVTITGIGDQIESSPTPVPTPSPPPVIDEFSVLPIVIVAITGIGLTVIALKPKKASQASK